MNANKDYYSTLGVSKQTAPDEIRKAYRKFAFKWHPDRNRTPGAEDRFKEGLEAYEVLSDSHKKTIYDFERSRNNSGIDSDVFSAERSQRRGEPTVDVDDIFEEFRRRYSDFDFRPEPRTIDDFVGEVKSNAEGGYMSSAQSAYRNAQRFAGQNPDRNARKILESMKNVLNNVSNPSRF